MDSWLKNHQLLCLPGVGSTWPDTPMTQSNIHPTTPLRQSWPSMLETTSLFGAILMRYATNIQSKTFLPFSSSIFFVLLNIFRGGGDIFHAIFAFNSFSFPPPPVANWIVHQDGFFDGEILDGRKGLVPSNFIERLEGEHLLDFYKSVFLGIGDGDDSGCTTPP